MADLSISPEEVRAALDSFVESYQPAQVATDEVGHVTETADGIAQNYGKRTPAFRGWDAGACHEP